MNEHSAKPNLARPRSALAILAICASLLLAAVGLNLTSAPSGTMRQIVRDPENPAYVGNTIGSSATTGSKIVRDPENPAYVGNTIDPSTTPLHTSQIVRDPENPYWIGATIGSTSVGGGSAHGLK